VLLFVVRVCVSSMLTQSGVAQDSGERSVDSRRLPSVDAY